MKILFSVNHPAQYYLFKNCSKILKQKLHQVQFIIRDKDILEKLLLEEKVEFFKINSKTKAKSKIGVLFFGVMDIITRDFKLLIYCLKNRPSLMIGTDFAITHVGFVLRIPSIVLNEDDLEINKYFCKLAYPLANHIISPEVCSVGKYTQKKISYNGYQKLAYLHPKYFIPKIEVLVNYNLRKNEYVLIRLVKFNAGHDVESLNSGITTLILDKMIDLLSLNEVKILISSEELLPEKYSVYKLKIKHSDIHNIMFYSKLFIADSQSMIVEASMLGVPSIRFNSFVGKISVMNELENKYHLTNGIHIEDIDQLLTKISQLLIQQDYREKLLSNKIKMLTEKISLTDFLVWFIENYPNSPVKLKKEPDYIRKFIFPLQ